MTRRSFRRALLLTPFVLALLFVFAPGTVATDEAPLDEAEVPGSEVDSERDAEETEPESPRSQSDR